MAVVLSAARWTSKKTVRSSERFSISSSARTCASPAIGWGSRASTIGA